MSSGGSEASGGSEEKADERRGPKSGQTMAEILPDKWSPEDAVAPHQVRDVDLHKLR